MAYHHGDARVALLSAAAELLERDDAGRLSLRQVAERAGLSRQAPYNHFDSREALLAELACDGFAQLGAAVADTGPDATPFDRLVTAAEAYIAFGQQRPALFRLMFGRDRVDIARFPAVGRAAAALLSRLSAIVAAVRPASDPAETSLVAWSLVHGYTSLCVEIGLEESSARQRRAVLFARTLAGIDPVADAQ